MTLTVDIVRRAKTILDPRDRVSVADAGLAAVNRRIDAEILYAFNDPKLPWLSRWWQRSNNPFR